MAFANTMASPRGHAVTVASGCGEPLAPGPLREPPQIEMSSLPLNDQGKHELILGIHNAGDRFCYHYRANGVTYDRAPVFHVYPGETFALRIVNEITGPASGLTMPASTLAPCSPQRMPDIQAQHFVGYLDHVMDARHVKMDPVDTNIHLHGFQGPASEEDIFLSTLSSPSHACEYNVKIPLSQPPGTYFYHPHAHGMSEDEVDGGLDGMWIVDSPRREIPGTDEHDVILRYRVPFENDGPPVPSYGALFLSAASHEARIKPTQPPSYDPFDPPAWPSSIPLRYGRTSIAHVCGTRDELKLSVDGRDLPASLVVPSGSPQLLRLLNATGDATLMLRMRNGAGRNVPMDVVGRDGIPVGGNLARPLDRYAVVDSIMFLPAGRRDLLITLRPGERETLYGAHFCSAPGDAIHRQRDILAIVGGREDPPAHPVQARALPPSQSPAATLIGYAREHTIAIRKRAFTYTEYVLPTRDGKSAYAAYMIAQTSDPDFRERTFYAVYASKYAMAPEPSVVVKHGTIEEWYLFNATLETHSFHIHQMDFVDENGPNGPETVDTAYLPPAKALPNKADPDYPLLQPSVTRVLLDFRHVPRGTFVFHCHMMHHEDRGMMGVIRVE